MRNKYSNVKTKSDPLSKWRPITWKELEPIYQDFCNHREELYTLMPARRTSLFDNRIFNGVCFESDLGGH